MGRVDQSSQVLSRRAFAWSLAGAIVARACMAAERDRPGRLGWSAEPAPRLSLERRYRADAQVLLFGLTLPLRIEYQAKSYLRLVFDAVG